MTIPLNNRDIERAVLGAMLISDDAAAKACTLLDSSDFYYPAHQVIFRVVRQLVYSGTAVDQFTVTEALTKEDLLEKIGGEAVISTLMSETASWANVEYHCGIVKEYASKRELAKTLSSFAVTAQEGKLSVNEIVESLMGQFNTILENTSDRQDDCKVQEIVVAQINKMEEHNTSGKGITGIDTGFPGLNYFTGGLQRGDLIILAGKPGHGKTALAVNITCNTARKGNKVYYFSLEMQREKLIRRMLQCESPFNLAAVVQRKIEPFEWERINKGGERIFHMPITINDKGNIGIGELFLKAKQAKKTTGVDLVIVDYLQLVNAGLGKNKSTQEEVSHVVRELKALAMNLEIPVLAISALSRGIETSGPPTMRHLRASGEIEYAADVILMVYDPHTRDNIKDYGYGEDNKFVRELIIEKNRDGYGNSFVKLRWNPEYTFFHDLEVL